MGKPNSFMFCRMHDMREVWEDSDDAKMGMIALTIPPTLEKFDDYHRGFSKRNAVLAFCSMIAVNPIPEYQSMVNQYNGDITQALSAILEADKELYSIIENDLSSSGDTSSLYLMASVWAFPLWAGVDVGEQGQDIVCLLLDRVLKMEENGKEDAYLTTWMTLAYMSEFEKWHDAKYGNAIIGPSRFEGKSKMDVNTANNFRGSNSSNNSIQNGWKCSCGRTNPMYVGTCACGRNKESIIQVQQQNNSIQQKKEQVQQPEIDKDLEGLNPAEQMAIRILKKKGIPVSIQEMCKLLPRSVDIKAFKKGIEHLLEMQKIEINSDGLYSIKQVNSPANPEIQEPKNNEDESLALEGAYYFVYKKTEGAYKNSFVESDMVGFTFLQCILDTLEEYGFGVLEASEKTGKIVRVEEHECEENERFRGRIYFDAFFKDRLKNPKQKYVEGSFTKDNRLIVYFEAEQLGLENTNDEIIEDIKEKCIEKNIIERDAAPCKIELQKKEHHLIDLDLYATIGAKFMGIMDANSADIAATLLLLNTETREKMAKKINSSLPGFLKASQCILNNNEILKSNSGSVPNLSQEFDYLFEFFDPANAGYPKDVYYLIYTASLGAFLDRDSEDKSTARLLVQFVDNLSSEIEGFPAISLLTVALWFSDYRGYKNLVLRRIKELSEEGFFNDSAESVLGRNQSFLKFI